MQIPNLEEFIDDIRFVWLAHNSRRRPPTRVSREPFCSMRQHWRWRLALRHHRALRTRPGDLESHRANRG
jgi:hypothetical protein